MGKLVLFRADGTAQDIKLDRERMTIGRRPDNDICLAQPAVSGEHAAVVTILSDSFLEDLGSTNGTRVNGGPITKHFLRDGDEIGIGRLTLVYLVDDSAKIDAPRQRPNGPDDRPGGAGRAPAALSAAAAGPGTLRDKRRTDAPLTSARPEGETPRAVAARSDEGRRAANDTGGAPQAPRGEADAAPVSAADGPVGPDPVLEVLSGAYAGRRVALTKPETLVGRAGVQVAALRRDADEIRVVPIEGSVPPTVNGAPVAPDGQRLVAGDILEIAGARLGLFVAPDADG